MAKKENFKICTLVSDCGFLARPFVWRIQHGRRLGGPWPFRPLLLSAVDWFALVPLWFRCQISSRKPPLALCHVPS